ncbi:NAD(P)/FAD-dependent oxidoreductase [Bacillus timonensis]|nr:NAD(P)/FAD-dependent oxidoreductase [Bacillus timonensis]
MEFTYDCIIIGGGIAGLQAAIQLGRYKHRILVIDSMDARSLLCKSYHNILGWPDGVSGEELRKIGRNQAEDYGVNFYDSKVENVKKKKDLFLIECCNGSVFYTTRLLLATGIMDRIPRIKNIKDCLGLSIYVCPDCDGYEVKDKKTLVLGAGMTGANMAKTLTYWTKDITYINHDGDPLSAGEIDALNKLGIEYIESIIKEVVVKEITGEMKGVKLINEVVIPSSKAFIAFGNNEVRSQLAKQIGIERLENKHILVDSRTKETNVKNVWAAGDILTHSEQVTIAMGDGMQAAIWIHKSIMMKN